jgi:hypothetical protein
MFGAWLVSIKHFGMALLERVQAWTIAKTKSATTSQVPETAQDLLMTKGEPVAEDALSGAQCLCLCRTLGPFGAPGMLGSLLIVNQAHLRRGNTSTITTWPTRIRDCSSKRPFRFPWSSNGSDVLS